MQSLYVAYTQAEHEDEEKCKMLKTIKESFKILISSMFYGYASVMVRNGSFGVADKYIKKSYKWSANTIQIS